MVGAGVRTSVIEEWEERAKRPGLLSVMSTRWTQKECTKATKKLRNDIFSFIPSLDGERVLDIGCGIGRFTRDLAEYAMEVVAIDISPKMILRAKRNINSNNIKFMHKSLDDIGVRESYFDVVFEVTVLQHIVDDSLFRKSLDEIKRAVNIKGYIFLCGEISDIHKAVSPVTVIRTLSEYRKDMKPFELVKSKKHKCITDTYTLTLWKKR